MKELFAKVLDSDKSYSKSQSYFDPSNLSVLVKTSLEKSTPGARVPPLYKQSQWAKDWRRTQNAHKRIPGSDFFKIGQITLTS